MNGAKSNALLHQPANHHAFGECVKEGIYIFGGKNEKGYLCNKLRLLKVTINPSDEKVTTAEWNKLK